MLKLLKLHQELSEEGSTTVVQETLQEGLHHLASVIVLLTCLFITSATFSGGPETIITGVFL